MSTRSTYIVRLVRWLPPAVAALLGVGLVACGGLERRPASEWRAAYDTVGDTVIVRSQSGSVWGEAAGLVADLRIGEFEGPDEYMFGYIQSLAVAPDGGIYVYDSNLRALRKYALDGRYVATFGREGGGPGEYKQPDAGLVVLRDGRVLLRDPGNGRINVYSPDGEYLDGWRIRPGLMTFLPLYVDTSDYVYHRVTLNVSADISEWRTGLVRYRPDGVASDTLEPPGYDYEPPMVEARAGGERRGYTSTPVPFSPHFHWSFSPLGYIVAGVSNRYAIDLYLAPDRVLRIERADWQPVPVKPEERAEQERRITAMLQGIQPGWRWNGPPIADAKPPYRDFFIGQDGRIWVQLYQEGRQTGEEVGEIRPGRVPPPTWTEPVAFDVFAADGRYLGFVRAPEGFTLHPTPVARGDTVWAVVRDEMDVSYIVRFRVRHAAAGAG
ncbi:MAG: hypothetical protein JSV41_13440 [Gemmatimonadota bacterium]|nr:MAG: hypothetical protein JSV41_13440 [Gemmatimonadota bacterium]